MDEASAELNVKTVTTLTGLNESTLRAWERRYGAVEPSRTKTGRRRYSFDDVERLRLLVRLTEAGQAIGDVATLTDRELALRLENLDSSDRAASEVSRNVPSRDVAADKVLAIAAALQKFDLAAVTDLVDQARFQASPRTFVLETVGPLMVRTGSLVATGRLSVAQEHALSAVVKAHLLEMIFSASRARYSAKAERRIALATMEGDLHEIGLLIAGVLCAAHGRTVLYLGANMPAQPLAEAVKALDTGALLLGATKLPAGTLRQPVEAYLRQLGKALPSRHRVWLGGVPNERIDATRAKLTLVHLPTFEALDALLQEES